MRNDPLYRPDRSLLHAVLVLLGGLGTIAAGLYLLTAIEEPVSRWGRGELADAPVDRWTPSSPRGSVLRGIPAKRRRLAPESGSAPAGMSVPTWAGSERQFAPSGPSTSQAPQSNYDIRPDFGHAELGSPSASSGEGVPGGRGGGPTGTAPETASSTPDLSGRSFGGSATRGDVPQWRSEARALASRSRALSNAIGRLDRQGSRGGSRSRSGDAEGTASGEATTASGSEERSSSGPGMPDGPPQVPLGGTEWLAAAGAAYALNRLRNGDSEDSDDGE